MSRKLRLVLALASVLMALFSTGVAHSASAPSTIGVSQSFRDFGLKYPDSYDPNRSYDATKDITKSTSWSGLGVKALRVIVPWDIALRDSSKPGYARRVEFEKWLERVKAISGSPYVVFGPTEEATNLADSSHKTRRTGPTGLVAPYPADFEKAIKKFLEIWGVGGSASGTTFARVKLIAPWNEPNLAELEMQLPGHLVGKHKIYMPGDKTTRSLADRGGCSHPGVTNCGPHVVAEYWWRAHKAMVAVQNCTDCYVVAGEFTGASGSGPRKYWETYANRLEAVSGGLKPAIISFHSHHDYLPEAPSNCVAGEEKATCTNCKPGNLKACTTVAFYKWLAARGNGWQNRKIWDTEVGAGHYKTTNAEQEKRLKFLLKTTGNYHVKRIYYFNYWPGQATKTDRGLLNTGTTVNTSPRPAYSVIKAITCPTSPCASASADTFEAGAQIAEAEPDTSEPEIPAEEEEVKEEFTTDEEEISEDQLPEVETEEAAVEGAEKATLRGIVSPNEEWTSLRFEYGQTSSYGSVTSSQSVAGDEEVLESASVANLIPGTTYHYRIVAENAHGVSEGEDRTLKTADFPKASAGYAVSNAPGQMQLFKRASDGTLRHRWYSPSTGWSTWANFGGSLAGNPVAVSWGEGSIDVFVRWTDNSVRHKWYLPSTGWSAWESLGGVAVGDPTAVSWGYGRIDLFVRGTDNALWHKWFDGLSWTANWESLGGVLTSDPTSISWADNSLNVFVRGSGNVLFQNWYATGVGWSGWKSLGGSIASKPAAITWGYGHLDVYARGFDNAVWHTWFGGSPGDWYPWSSLGGSIQGTPSGVSWGTGSADVFARGIDNNLWHTWFGGSPAGWQAWSSLGGAITSDPYALSVGYGQENAFALGANGEMGNAYFAGNPGSWVNFFVMP